MDGDEEAEEESRLVRSASIGKRAKPTLVSATTRTIPMALDDDVPGPGPGPQVVEDGPFTDGAEYVEDSEESSDALPRVETAAPPQTVSRAISGDSATDPAYPGVQGAPPPSELEAPNYSRFSAIRRPPRLDTENPGSRVSLTSLPDMIRRATRLVASLEKGLRPASRLGDLNGFPDLAFGKKDGDREMSFDAEKHPSGFSDMLAAFPPPAQATARQSFRQSPRQQAFWPIRDNNGNSVMNDPNETAVRRDNTVTPIPGSTKGRRCCGLPVWGFIIVVIVVLVLIAAAVVIPLEFFVIRKQDIDNTDAQQQALQMCQQQITCANGGRNMVDQGFCSCLCVDGFTGFDCSVPSGAGCTTMSLPGDSNLSNATTGAAIPRLIKLARTNFSIPLSAEIILAKLNSGNLSCAAENALVTFDGKSTQQSDGDDQVTATRAGSASVVNEAVFEVVTVVVGSSATLAAGNDGYPDTGKVEDGYPYPAAITTTTVKETIISPPNGAPTPSGDHSGDQIPPLVIPSAIPPSSTDSSTTPLPTHGPSPTEPSTPGSSTPDPSPTHPSTTGPSTTGPSTTDPSTPGPSTTNPSTTDPSTATTPVSCPQPPAATPSTVTPVPVVPVFKVTDQVLDFARVAVLYILQLESVVNAMTAQAQLQTLFTLAESGGGVTVAAMSNVTVGNGNSVDLVHFLIDAGPAGNGTLAGGTGAPVEQQMRSKSSSSKEHGRFSDRAARRLRPPSGMMT